MTKVYTITPCILIIAIKSACCRFHAQRFYALNCLATKDANATPIKADITLNMMLIEMPVAKAEEFHRHVQVSTFCACLHGPSSHTYTNKTHLSTTDQVLLVCTFAMNITANNMRYPLKADLKHPC